MVQQLGRLKTTLEAGSALGLDGVDVAAPEDGEQTTVADGCSSDLDAVKEEGGRPKFGFIRCEASEAQLFFHVSELEPGLTPTPGCEVMLASYHPSP